MRRARSRAAQAKAISWQQAVLLPLAGLLLITLVATLQ